MSTNPSSSILASPNRGSCRKSFLSSSLSLSLFSFIAEVSGRSPVSYFLVKLLCQSLRQHQTNSELLFAISVKGDHVQNRTTCRPHQPKMNSIRALGSTEREGLPPGLVFLSPSGQRPRHCHTHSTPLPKGLDSGTA